MTLLATYDGHQFHLLLLLLVSLISQRRLNVTSIRYRLRNQRSTTELLKVLPASDGRVRG